MVDDRDSENIPYLYLCTELLYVEYTLVGPAANIIHKARMVQGTSIKTLTTGRGNFASNSTVQDTKTESYVLYRYLHTEIILQTVQFIQINTRTRSIFCITISTG